MERHPPRLATWLPVALSAGVLLGLYLATTAADLTWAHSNEDSGDLVTAAWVRGIPHPTGYPWYLVTCKALMDLVPGGTIAWRAHLYSILSGIGAVTLAGWALRQMLPALAPQLDAARFGPWVQATAMLLIGGGIYFWTQCIIAEVYATNAAFLALLLLLLALWITTGEVQQRDRLFCLFGLAQGFALTNHLTSLYGGFAAVVVLLWSRRLPGWRTWLAMAGCLLAPLSLYGVLLLYSRANPPLDWTNTETLSNLWIHATGKQFRYLLLGLDGGQVMSRLMQEMDFIRAYGAIPAIAALGGIAAGLTGTPAIRAFTLGLLALWGINVWHIANYAVHDIEAFLVPAALVLGLLAVMGLAALAHQAAQGRVRALLPACWALTLAMCGWLMAANYPLADIPHPTDPILMRDDAKAHLPPGALLIERYYARGFAWWYFQYTESYWQEQGIEIIYTESLRSQWGQDLLRRTNPAVRLTHAPTPAEGQIIANLIEENVALRPLFTGFTPYLDPARYQVTPAGRLFRIHLRVPEVVPVPAPDATPPRAIPPRAAPPGAAGN